MIVLTKEEILEITALINSAETARLIKKKARFILLLNEGKNFRFIEDHLRMSYAQSKKWLNLFNEKRLSFFSLKSENKKRDRTNELDTEHKKELNRKRVQRYYEKNYENKKEMIARWEEQNREKVKVTRQKASNKYNQRKSKINKINKLLLLYSYKQELTIDEINIISDLKRLLIELKKNEK